MKNWTQNLRFVHEQGTSKLVATCETVTDAKLIASLPTILSTAQELLEAYKIERNALISESDKFGIHENTEEYKECIDLMKELIIRSESTVQSLLLALSDCTSHRSK